MSAPVMFSGRAAATWARSVVGARENLRVCARSICRREGMSCFFYHTVIHNLKKIVEMNVKHSMYDNIFEIESQQV